MNIVAINGSPSKASKTRTLAALAVKLAGGGERSVIDLGELDASALLGRHPDCSVDIALRMTVDAEVVVVATPVTRGTFSALTKAFFDLLAPNALGGHVVIPIAVGFTASHRLAIDHGIRPLVSDLGAWITPTGVYGTDADFDRRGRPTHVVHTQVWAAVKEAGPSYATPVLSVVESHPNESATSGHRRRAGRRRDSIDTAMGPGSGALGEARGG